MIASLVLPCILKAIELLNRMFTVFEFLLHLLGAISS